VIDLMSGWGRFALLVAAVQTAAASPTAMNLFNQGRSFGDFVGRVNAQRDVWRKNVADASVPADLLSRFSRVAPGLQLLVVAEDWCPDSVHTVPYIARMADGASVELRVVDRKDGAPIMQRHTTPDGRQVTPTVVLLRHGQDVGAWIERPVPLQRLFQSLADPESARQFADRERWYAADRGRTTLTELVQLAERTNDGRRF
jgi:hypothetical protein